MKVGDEVTTPDGVTGRVLEIDVKHDQILVDLGGPRGVYASAALKTGGPAPAKEG